MTETLSSARLREALEKTICHACGNPIGWNGVHDEANKRLWRSDWRECSFCKRARAALSLPEREPSFDCADCGYENGQFAPCPKHEGEYRRAANPSVHPAPGAGEGLREALLKIPVAVYQLYLTFEECEALANFLANLRSASPVGPKRAWLNEEFQNRVNAVVDNAQEAGASPVAEGPDIVLREVERGQSFKGKHGKLGRSAQPKDREGR